MPTATAVFHFVPMLHRNPNVGVNYSTMAHAVLPNTFRALRTVTFQIANSSTTALSPPVAYFDNISFAVTNTTH